MTDRSDDTVLEIDEIDRRILEILANDPRSPYADISDELAQHGIELSSEGVRRRVTTLLDDMTSFFLPRPERNSWEIVLVTIKTENCENSKRDAFEAMADMDFWFVAEGFGTIDLYGIMTAKSNSEIGDLLVRLEALDSVREINHFIETDRAVNIRNYLPVY
ncbi:DNA-binding transcriptional regulator, Lrp family [Natronorubrum sediminis]|uniref:DNA-binding transcriptional regulator, Lrp family n=1 Tax=Natronorubrum sediminis TaxID=640943 RepID=A0A1H6G5D4_9EURY|nr:AsnC family transcriptional regulator [Natronorubrum sediminis]SEH17194.1 DNA-binding transcriptional regulator, Lrp family [Natronorubrum sediminis]